MKLKALIAQYVAFRKSLGARFENSEGRLNAFCRWMGEEINVTDVQAEQVNAFLAGTGLVTRSWQERHGLVNGLYRYAISRGLVVTSPLPTTKPKLPDRFVPYIYSRTELRRLFNSTTAACPKGHCKLEPHTLRAILLLLYGAGLRVSEALTLTLDDVDLTGALLTVRDTKFHKTRMVPLGAELNQEMARYAVRRTEAGLIKVVRHAFLSCAGVDRYSARSSNGDSKAYVSMRMSNGSMALVINRDCMICATPSPFTDLCRGTNRVLTSRNCCRSCPPTWGISALVIPNPISQ